MVLETVSFVDVISDCEVDETKDAQFVCHVSGHPTVTWSVYQKIVRNIVSGKK